MNKPLDQLSEDEIDKIVTAEADDDSAWGEPITVRTPKGGMTPRGRHNGKALESEPPNNDWPLNEGS